jgi:hypothetical protein
MGSLVLGLAETQRTKQSSRSFPWGEDTLESSERAARLLHHAVVQALVAVPLSLSRSGSFRFVSTTNCPRA